MAHRPTIDRLHPLQDAACRPACAALLDRLDRRQHLAGLDARQRPGPSLGKMSDSSEPLMRSRWLALHRLDWCAIQSSATASRVFAWSCASLALTACRTSADLTGLNEGAGLGCSFAGGLQRNSRIDAEGKHVFLPLGRRYLMRQ